MERYIDFDEPYVSDNFDDEEILEIEELPRNIKDKLFKEIDEEFREEEESDLLKD